MHDQHTTPSACVADLARLVDCLDENEFATLAGVKQSTLKAWRKRGQGPEYILLGCNYLYPLEAVRNYITRLVRTRTEVTPAMMML
jgi:hypothetical protein